MRQDLQRTSGPDLPYTGRVGVVGGGDRGFRKPECRRQGRGKNHEESSHSHSQNTSHPYPAQQAVCAVAVKLQWSANGAVPPTLRGGGNHTRGCELHDHHWRPGCRGRMVPERPKTIRKEGTQGEQRITESCEAREKRELHLFVKETKIMVK